MSSVNRINVQSCHGKTESKADLVSMEASGGKYFSNSLPFKMLDILFFEYENEVMIIDKVSISVSDSNGQRSNGRLQNQLTFSASAWARR